MKYLEFYQILESAKGLPLYEKKYANLTLTQMVADPGCIPLLESRDLISPHPLSLIGSRIAYAQTVFFSSGTYGHPKVIFLGKDDLARIVWTCRQFCDIEGIHPDSRVLLILPMNLWSVGRITLEAIQSAGASVLPVSTQTPKEVWGAAALRFQPNIISSTPSILADLSSMEIDLPPQRIIETTGEPLPYSMRSHLHDVFEGTVRDAYGLTECVIGTECSQQKGYHLVPGSVVIEIVDRQTGRPIGPGGTGEIVVSSLMQELMPIVRYRTGDLGILDRTPCPCRYPSPRLRVLGRINETVFLPAGVQFTNLEALEVLAPFANDLIPRPRIRVNTSSRRPPVLDLYVPIRDPSLLHSAHVHQMEQALRDRMARASLDFSDLVDCGEVEIGEVTVVLPSAEDLREHRKPLLSITEVRQ